MADATSRQPTSDRIKGRLRNLPFIYAAGKWVYRRFRKSDPTIQERILKALGGNMGKSFFVGNLSEGTITRIESPPELWEDNALELRWVNP